MTGFWYKAKYRKARQGKITLHFVRDENDERSVCGMSLNLKKKLKDEDREPTHQECKHCLQSIRFSEVTGELKPSRGYTIPMPHKLKNKPKPDIILKSEGQWVKTKCSECGVDVLFWNEKKQQEHYCTNCEKIVNLPFGVVA